MGFGNHSGSGRQTQFARNGSLGTFTLFVFKEPYAFEQQMEFPPTHAQSLALKALAVSVEKKGLPVPQPNTTTLPLDK